MRRNGSLWTVGVGIKGLQQCRGKSRRTSKAKNMLGSCVADHGWGELVGAGL